MTDFVNSGQRTFELPVGASITFRQGAPGALATIAQVWSDGATGFTSTALTSAPVTVGPLTADARLLIAATGIVAVDFGGVGGGATTYAALTDAATATLPTTNTALATALATKVNTLAPIVQNLVSRMPSPYRALRKSKKLFRMETFCHACVNFNDTFATNVKIQNNLGYGPLDTTYHALIFEQFHPTAAYTVGGNSNNAQVGATSPLWATTPPAVTADWLLQGASYAKNAGINVPNWSDFFGTVRVNGSMDMGATEQ